MKKLLCLALLAALLMAGAALAEVAPCEARETLPGPSGEALATLSATGFVSEKPGAIHVLYALTNDCGLALTRITFNVTYLDAGGEALRDPIQIVKGYLEAPLPAGETAAFEHSHYFEGAERTAGIAIEPVLAETELDLKPWNPVRPNRLLLDFCNDPDFSAHFENLEENPPVALVIRRDEQPEIVIDDPEAILAELQSLRDMRIGEESDVTVTDSASYYAFTMADGEEWGVSFEAPGLFYWHGRVYEVLRGE